MAQEAKLQTEMANKAKNMTELNARTRIATYVPDKQEKMAQEAKLHHELAGKANLNYKYCFAWDCNEMSGLSKKLVELKLPIQSGKKPVKQLPKRFALAVMSKIKEEIERLMRRKFIKTTRYVEWLANIVPVIKKNETLWVCIEFRDLNKATPKDACRKNDCRLANRL
ncbi:uncharacterized protein LOC127094919 [Lathyrus oleraceus]|uniref:uncharacterized protein LOC127094919 n=1 Tax=Pisum sativum TaxID=3888 RepID=UPI0021D088BB|nr:uncharacterized protein LOC127094919 [Pisum sativum]